MSEYAETMLESDLQEVLGGKPAPDLSGQALQRLRESNRPAPGLPQAATPRRRWPGWRWIAHAAGIAIVLGLIGWLVTRPERDTVTYLAGPGAKIVAIDNRLELSEGTVVLRTGAPELLILDKRGNTRVASVQGLAIAGTQYRDGMELPDEGELARLGLTEEERNMWPNVAKNIVTTGALTLLVFTGSVVVDGLKVEAGKPEPDGLRPPVQWDSDSQPEPRPEDPLVVDNDNRQHHEKVETPKPDDIPGIKAMLGNVSAVSLRAMDEDMNWRGWMRVEAAADVQTLRKAFADNLKAKSVKIAGYDHLNEFMLQLKDGRTVGASVYTYVGAADGSGGRVDLTFPDQKGSTQYDADPALLKAVQPWLDRAAKVDPVGTSQAESVARLLRTAEKLVVNYNGHFLTVDSREEVRRVMEALTSAGFTASDRDLSFKDPWDWVTIHLPGGLKANAIGLSQGPATYKGFFDVRIPDWPEHNAFTIPEAALPLLKDLFDRAAKQPKEDPGNPPAMRAWLGRARKVTFRDDFDKKVPVEGTLTTRPDLASLAAIVWPDGIVEVADDQGTSRTVLQLTWHMEGGETLACEICDNGWLAMRVPGPGDLLFRMIPASHPGLIHELLARQGKAATPLPVSVLRSWAGPNSGVKKARAEVLTTEDQWRKTWAEHDPAAELPKIDFEREMVMAIFDGDSWNSRGFYVHELLAGDNGATIIRVDEHTYQTMGEGDRVTPFGIFVITRTGRTLTVEENAQSIIGKPPLWKPLTARIEMFSDLPALDKVFAKYQAAQSWVGKGGRGVEQFRSAINADEWKDLWDEITPSHPGANVLPEIDWSKHVAVAVSGKIMEGLGDYSFTYVGANGSRTVLRLHTPTAQTDGAPPVMENRYAIWVLPRPAGSLVVETPRFGRLDQPPSWLEEHVLKVR